MSAPLRALRRPQSTLRSSIALPTTRSRRYLTTNNGFFRVSDEVRDALNANKPIVALETTIYTHGWSYPDNVALASHLESIVRVNGGVPATIGILDGIARVGMSPEELIQLTASAGQKTTLKLSRRDLGYVCGLRLTGKRFNGGTTIAGTMLLAHLAGIKVFATGGLGGVHRGAESSMDISADLTELGRTPVTVISSGSKSFLDIPRTLEYLETEGVGVGTFADGRTGNVDFPAFWSRDSGVKSPTVIENEIDAAAIIHAQNSLQILSGLLFANPVPEEFAIPKPEMDSLIEEAVKQANASGASGKDNTPFVLSKLKELSGGKTIPANRALIESNVRRATIVARELAILEAKQQDAQGGNSTYLTPHQPLTSTSVSHATNNSVSSPSSSRTSASPTTVGSGGGIIVAGALAADFSCDYAPLEGSSAAASIEPQPHTSNPAIIRQSLGGVGRNIAKAAHLVGSSVRLCSAVGNDLSGRAALSQLQEEGMDTEGIVVVDKPYRTAQYIAVNNAHKDLSLAMADMSILESDTHEIASLPKSLDSTRCLLVDANWSAPKLHSWLQSGRSCNALTIFEPVSTAKAGRLFIPSSPKSPPAIFPNHAVDIATPNVHELRALYDKANSLDLFSHPNWFQVIDGLGIPSSGLRTPLAVNTRPELVDEGIPQQCIKLLPFIPLLLTKLGPKGILMTSLVAANDPLLSDPDEAKYILARCNNGDETIGGLYVRLFPPDRVLGPDEVISVNGAGDTFLGVLAAGLVKGENALISLGDVRQRVLSMIPTAQRASLLTLKSQASVSLELKQLAKEIQGL